MADRLHLRQLLHQLNDRSYKAYKDIRGRYEFPEFLLCIDRVQGDPFAAPSQVRVLVSYEVAGFPLQTYENRSRAIAFCDYLTRQFGQVCHQVSDRRGTGNSGLIQMLRVGQEVLSRTSIILTEKGIEARFTVGLPAQGRRILGYQAGELLCEDLPEIVAQSLKYENLSAEELQAHIETVEDAEALRSQLSPNHLVAFVADGAILPRRSGVDRRALADGAIPFQSPESLRVTLETPNRGAITGMGIPQGVTLIVGGGYHGKSTLLKAIELGIYNHIPGDGRELVVSDRRSVKIRAEDGRAVTGVDISPFIQDLPQNLDTRAFSSTNASGSTSQAANMMEALEVGAKLFLVDEDTAATNFMIRDRRMQALIAKTSEPITPLIDKVRQLYSDYGVSTLLVIGGSGDYFDVADTVIAMNHFVPKDLTEAAQAIAEKYPTERQIEGGDHFGPISARIPLGASVDPSQGHKPVKLKVRDVNQVVFGADSIDLADVEQLVEVGQLKAIAEAMVYAKENYLDGQHTLAETLEAIFADIDQGGLDALTRFREGNLVEFRPFELAAAFNRLRSLSVKTMNNEQLINNDAHLISNMSLRS